MTDKMMKTYLSGLDQQFVTQGGIKERMYAARTGYRKGQDEEMQRLRDENKSLRQQIPILMQRIETLEQEKRHLEVLLMQERGKGNSLKLPFNPNNFIPNTKIFQNSCFIIEIIEYICTKFNKNRYANGLIKEITT